MDTKHCPRCDSDKATKDFYVTIVRGKRKIATYCKPCAIKQKLDRIKEVRNALKRGKSCALCGYSKCPAALDFHHLNASNKRFTIAYAIGRTSSKELPNLLEELKKTVILCANCHREVHHGDATLEGVEPSFPELGPQDFVQLSYSVRPGEKIRAEKREAAAIAKNKADDLLKQSNDRWDSINLKVRELAAVIPEKRGRVAEIARQVGVSHTHVRRVLNGKTASYPCFRRR